MTIFAVIFLLILQTLTFFWLILLQERVWELADKIIKVK